MVIRRAGVSASCARSVPDSNAFEVIDRHCHRFSFPGTRIESQGIGAYRQENELKRQSAVRGPR